MDILRVSKWKAKMAQAVVGKWGNNLAVRLTAEIARAARLESGAVVSVEAHDGAVIIRRSATKPTLAQLFAGRAPQDWRADYRGAFDWGPDVGREILEP